MSLPTYYYSARLTEPMIVLPATNIVYFQSNPAAVYFIHIHDMCALMDRTIEQNRGDIDMGRRFDGHWAVICLYSQDPPTTLAFTVWAGEWMDTLNRITVVQRLARSRTPRLRAYRRNEVAKLKAFKAQAASVLPVDLIQYIVGEYLEGQRARPLKPRAVRRVETDSYKQLSRSRPAAGAPLPSTKA